MDTEQKLFTFQEAAKMLNVSVRTLFDWRKKGKIKTIKLGRENRIQREEMERIINEGVSL